MSNNTHQRINITMPTETLQRIDTIAEPGSRSRFIDAAVNFYITQRRHAHLSRALQAGAVARAARDHELATEFFNFNDVWETRQA